jgi:hypothetical protein
MKYVVWGLILLLVVLHQDVWFWDDATLVFGFMPITLLYHAMISLAAGFTWWLATKYAWPAELEAVEAPASETKGDAGA